MIADYLSLAVLPRVSLTVFCQRTDDGLLFWHSKSEVQCLFCYVKDKKIKIKRRKTVQIGRDVKHHWNSDYQYKDWTKWSIIPYFRFSCCAFLNTVFKYFLIPIQPIIEEGMTTCYSFFRKICFRFYGFLFVICFQWVKIHWLLLKTRMIESCVVSLHNPFAAFQKHLKITFRWLE